VGHYGGRGVTAAAMVCCVLTTYKHVCCVLCALYVRILPRGKTCTSAGIFRLYIVDNPYTRFAWAGGTFFPVVLLCQFLVLAGNRFWFYILTYAT
jgi:hypothetical protein